MIKCYIFYGILKLILSHDQLFYIFILRLRIFLIPLKHNVYSSGTAKIFPKDIAVGKIVMIKNEEVFALPFVDTQNLNFVQIIEIK